MRARTSVRRRPISEINVVPYIDVMLVLLIIFMITAPLLSQGVKVDLPQADAEPLDMESQEPLVVTIDAAANYYVNYGDDQHLPVERPVLASRVGALLRHRPGLAVVVRGDENVPYGDVVLLMTILQRAGAPTVGLMTESPRVAEQ